MPILNLPPFLLVALAIPVLLLGEWLVRRVWLLSRFNIPSPVAGGLLVALVLLLLELAGIVQGRFTTKTDAWWWTWIVTAETEWSGAPSKPAHLPFMVAFFTCVGLNASWDLVKRGGRLLIGFLVLASILAAIQNVVGIAVAKALQVAPVLGMICGGMTMTGGHGIGLGFAPVVEKDGMAGASTLIAAAATFGLVSGGLLGGPVATWLIRRNQLRPLHDFSVKVDNGQSAQASILKDLKAFGTLGESGWRQFLLLLLCMKAGAWLSYAIQKTGFTFPAQIGAIILGAGLRNALDFSGRRWLQTETVDLFASVTLGLFLSMAMMSLNLAELAAVALPMLVILTVQVAVMAVFAAAVTFRAMGRDYEAAVIAAGHCGFGLGATPNAVANMKRLVEAFGPAPRAFLIVPVVGGFLIDIPNSLCITWFLNWVK
ncbi:MAG: sodium/glutamate symporter [Verrucomicrobiota bacterium]